jgi:hypothetical protein
VSALIPAGAPSSAGRTGRGNRRTAGGAPGSGASVAARESPSAAPGTRPLLAARPQQHHSPHLVSLESLFPPPHRLFSQLQCVHIAAWGPREKGKDADCLVLPTLPLDSPHHLSASNKGEGRTMAAAAVRCDGLPRGRAAGGGADSRRSVGRSIGRDGTTWCVGRALGVKMAVEPVARRRRCRGYSGAKCHICRIGAAGPARLDASPESSHCVLGRRKEWECSGRFKAIVCKPVKSDVYSILQVFGGNLQHRVECHSNLSD